ncbi:MAG: DNRLRE domain-containing protein [Byssovorax sp.]
MNDGSPWAAWRSRVLLWTVSLGAIAALGCAGAEPESAPPADEVAASPAEPVAEAQGAVKAPPVCVTFQRGVLGSVADTFLNQEKPANNYGANITDQASGAALLQQRALFRWNLSSIPADATVSSATVTLTQSNTGAASPRVHLANTPWTEGTVTWNSFGNGYDAAVLANLSNASATINFSLLATVQGWVNGSIPNNGILIEQAAASTTKFMSSEWAVVGSRPKLKVCYQVTCGPNNADCDLDGTNGCETAIDTPQNCGACGVACPPLPHAQASCAGGACGLGACDPGFGDCDGDPQNGCETPLDTATDCGGCGAVCGDGDICNGDEVCNAGVCDRGAPLDCDDGVACTVDSCDPASGCFSDPGPCQTPTCDDGIQNGSETGIDCGGPDCDACPTFPGAFDDFDVTAAGKVVAVSTGWDGKVTGTCFAANGNVQKTFIIAQVPQNTLLVGMSSVSTSRTTGGSIFGWYVGDWSSKTLMVRVYDGNCDPVSQAQSPTAPSNDFVYDTVADDLGHFAIMYAEQTGNFPNANGWVKFLDGAGNAMGAPLLADSTGICHGNYGMQVTVNPTTGAGIVTCQRHFFNPIYYRRFNAQHQWIDGGMVVIPETTNNHSSWYVSHQTGMDAAGNFVFEWQDYSENNFKASFYTPQMGLITTKVLGTTEPGTWPWDGFRHLGSRVALYGSDFVLRDEGIRTIYWRYSAAGEMLACGVGFKDSSPVHVDGQDHVFTRGNMGIYRDDISLAGGCVIPTCTDGVKNGDEKGVDCGGVFCAPCVTCSDGVQDGDESGVDCGGSKCAPCAAPTCNDGKQNGMETGVDCGGACAACNPPACAGQSCSFNVNEGNFSALDYDVGADGTVVYLGTVTESDSATWVAATCARPDGSILRSRLALQGYPPNAYEGIFTQVVTSRVSKHTVLSWVGQDAPNAFEFRHFRGQILDGNCDPVGPAFDWPQGPSGNYVGDTAIDDAGNFALLYQDSNYVDAWVQFYHANGALDGAPLHVDDAGKCAGNYGIHVALNRTTGAGVITCQQHESEPVRYRRFDASHQWIDAALVDIPEAMNNHSSWYESHQLGVADSGAFVVEWEDATSSQFMANFYAPSGALLQSVAVQAASNFPIDGFRQANQKVRLLGADFVLRGEQSGGGTAVFRYATSGTLVGAASLPAWQTNHRYDAQGNTYTLQGSLLKNSFGL